MDPRFFLNRLAALPQGTYPFDELLSMSDGQIAREVIGGFPNYSPTPLAELPHVATAAGVARVFYKDEDKRFDVHSFKILGAGYAIATLLRNQISAHFKVPVSVADLVSRR
jgi:diaminopropionate ammonia-lyase